MRSLYGMLTIALLLQIVILPFASAQERPHQQSDKLLGKTARITAPGITPDHMKCQIISVTSDTIVVQGRVIKSRLHTTNKHWRVPTNHITNLEIRTKTKRKTKIGLAGGFLTGLILALSYKEDDRFTSEKDRLASQFVDVAYSKNSYRIGTTVTCTLIGWLIGRNIKTDIWEKIPLHVNTTKQHQDGLALTYRF